jgi:uncharacterized protein with GYD domain
MPTYIAYGKFTPAAIRGMTENPEDRTQPVTQLFEALGAKLLSWHVTLGCADFDWLLMVEAPSEDIVVSAAIAPWSGGSSVEIRVALALDGAQSKAMFQKSADAVRRFKPGGINKTT